MQQFSNPQYEIVNILFLESSFKRERVFDVNKQISVDLSVGKTVDINGNPVSENGPNSIIVDLDAHVTGLQEGETKVYECCVKLVGVFIESGKGNLEREKFADINAPAIMYAFLREYISNLAQKAGMNIFLPPINFVQLIDSAK